jgi:hypothetical protein
MGAMAGAGTIVVIDGSHAVLELCEQALESAGYHVLVTTDPFEVLAVMHTIKVDLVIGEAAKLEQFREDPVAPQLLEIDPDEDRPPYALRRPFSLEQLQRAVALALGSGLAVRT